MRPEAHVRVTLVTSAVHTPYRWPCHARWQLQWHAAPVACCPRTHPPCRLPCPQRHAAGICVGLLLVRRGPHRPGPPGPLCASTPGARRGNRAGHAGAPQLHRWPHGSQRLATLMPATSWPAQGQRVLLRGRPPLPYDVVSLNLGITPALSSVPGAAAHTTPVKPISGWALSGHRGVLGERSGGPCCVCKSCGPPPCALQSGAALRGAAEQGDGGRRAAAGGSGGWRPCRCRARVLAAVQVGSCLGADAGLANRVRLGAASPCRPAWRCRLTRERREAGITSELAVALVSRGPILAGVAPYARKAFLPLLQVGKQGARAPAFWRPYRPVCCLVQERGIVLHEVGGGVLEVQPSALVLGDGSQVPFDECLWSTQASAAGWLAATGLPLDKGGAATLRGRRARSRGACSLALRQPARRCLLVLPHRWLSPGGRMPEERWRAAKRVCGRRRRVEPQPSTAQGGRVCCPCGAQQNGAPGSPVCFGRCAPSAGAVAWLLAGGAAHREPAARSGRQAAEALDAPNHLFVAHLGRWQVCRGHQGLAG